jgi:hypothetical protein
VAGGGLQVISFIAAAQPYPRDRPVSLRVGFYLPSGTTPSILAAEKEPVRHYAMVSKPTAWTHGAWQVFGDWRTDAFLINGATRVEPDNLSVVVTLSDGPLLRLAPAIVYHADPPPEMRTYEIVLRSGYTLSRFSYVVEQAFPGQKKGIGRHETRVDKIAGRNFSVLLDMARLQDGPVQIAMEGDVKEEALDTKLTLMFEHRSKPAFKAPAK